MAIESVAEGDVSKGALGEYDRRWRAEFGNELCTGELLHAALKTSPDQKMDALFEAIATDSKLARAFVSAFRGMDLANALKTLLALDEIKRVFEPNVKKMRELHKF